MRTHYCGEVDESLVGRSISVAGWVHRRRDHGGVIFVDLRDREGRLQIVFDPTEAAVFAEAERLRGEWVIRVSGSVRPRPEGTVNPNLKSGAVELLAREIELLNRSDEGIASNILADRLKRLVEAGLLSKRDDPTHRQKGIYSLTEPAIQLVPLLAQMGAWGRRHTPVSEELSIRAQLLEEGGPPMWAAFMAELRTLHLGAPAAGPSVLAALQAAFEKVAARKRPARR